MKNHLVTAFKFLQFYSLDVPCLGFPWRATRSTHLHTTAVKRLKATPHVLQSGSDRHALKTRPVTSLGHQARIFWEWPKFF